MATNTGTGSIVSQCGYNGGWSSYGSASQYAGKSGSGYYTYILKFRTPAFTGVSERLRIILGAINGYGSTVTLRWALCTDDGNYSRHMGTAAAVADGYQIAAGSKKFTGLNASASYYNIYVNTAELESNTTYYLFLWASTSVSGFVEICATSYHMTTLGYNAGIVRIDNGESLWQYQAYIDDGSAWRQHLPEVDIGDAWSIGT